MEKIYYLAYGSNLNLSQMERRCKGSKVVGTAVLDDYGLMFKGSKTGSYLTIEKEKRCKVPLGVFEITKEDLLNLDIYEGYPTFYYRKLIEVKVKKKDGKIENLRGLIYIMHEDRKLGVPNDIYMNICIDGYKDFGFDTHYLFTAFEYSLEEIKKWQMKAN